ncbi:MAG: hypothetical protein LUF30_10835 [Lachnospiraceae bacterium]|nr:hypothetical protein [Lachnospiraceae bacterium]
MMIRRKRLTVFAAVIFLCFSGCLGGCSQQTNLETTYEDQNPVLTSDDTEADDDGTDQNRLNETEEAVTESAVQSNNNGSAPEMNQYAITAKQLDPERICAVLLPDYKASDIPPEEANGSVIIDAEEATLMMNDGLIEFSCDKNADQIENLLFGYYFMDSDELGVDLVAEAEKIGQENFISELGDALWQMLQLAENEELLLVRAICMDVENLQSFETLLVEREVEEDTVSSWKFEQYAALEFELVKDGVPLMGLNEPDQNYYMDVIGAQAAYLHVLLGMKTDGSDASYAADGSYQILSLSMRGMVETDTAETVNLLTEQEAIAIVEEAESLQLSETKWAFQAAKLEYVAVPDWDATLFEPEKLVPYWCIIGNEGEAVVATRINAVTGGNLAYAE